MKMSDKIKAIEEAVTYDYGTAKVLAAIEAARLWAAESDARFEQAREAFIDWDSDLGMCQEAPTVILRRFFRDGEDVK